MATEFLGAGLCLALFLAIYLALGLPSRLRREAAALQQEAEARARRARAELKAATAAEVAVLVAGLRAHHDELGRLAALQRGAAEVAGRLGKVAVAAAAEARQDCASPDEHAAERPTTEFRRGQAAATATATGAVEDDADRTNVIPGKQLNVASAVTGGRR
jgi:hypothetical protein